MPPRKPAEPAATSEKPARPKRQRKRTKSSGDRPTKPTIQQVLGRPPVYDQPYHDDHAKRLCLFGHTNEKLAEFFGISIATLELWIRDHPSFIRAIVWAREEADANVVRSLYNRAVGLQMKAVKIFMPAGSKEPIQVEYMENFPPEVPAIQLWLQNRQPEKWRRRDNAGGGRNGEPDGAGGGGNEVRIKIIGGLPDDS